MQAETQASLDQSRAYLRDCVEASHLMLKRKLEALRRGEDIDWAETRDVIREGRSAARQLTQIASVEVRDRQQTDRRERKPRPPQRVTPKVPVTPDQGMRFVEGVMQWQAAAREAGGVVAAPESLRKLMTEFGLDPDKEDSFELMLEIFDGAGEALQRSAA
jgi:hypothetical protein